MIVRVLLYVPPAMFQIDSDAVLSGLCAFKIAAGHYPAFFPGGSRLGAASCYVVAAYFKLFGFGRTGLALTALTWSALYLAFSLALLRALLPAPIACVAYLFAVFPSEQFMTVSYAPWAYGEIVASCAATLWLAACWRRDGAAWQRFAFGFSTGLGLWFSFETLMASLPAIVWVAWNRRRATIGELPIALAGFVAGAVPLLVGNVASSFATFTQNWASRPAASVPQFFANFWWLLTYLLPELLIRSSGWWSETTLLAVTCAVVAIAFVAAIRRGVYRDVALLVALVCASCIVIFSASAAGSLRGWTVRYVVPFYMVVPMVSGIGIVTIWARSRWLAAAVIAALVLPNLYLYGLPGTPQRAQLAAQLRADVRLRALLAQDRVRMVYGDYFSVYHLNFDSEQRIAGVPSAPVVDYFNYAGQLGTSPVRYALLGGEDNIRAWRHATGGVGTLAADGDLRVFIADRAAPNAAQLIAALRRANQ